MEKRKTFKIAFSGICATLSVISFVIENLFPPLFIPGAKLGVSNVFVLLTAISVGFNYGFIVVIVKVVLGSLFAGNISLIAYSLPSNLLALTVEFLLFKFNRGILSISFAGGIINVTVQNVIFCLITGTGEYFVYLPYLALIGSLSGTVIGFTVYLINKITSRFFIINFGNKEKK